LRTPSRRVRKWAAVAWMLVVLVAVAFVLRSRGAEVTVLLRQGRTSPLLLSLLFVLSAKALLASILRSAAGTHGVVLSQRESAIIYHRSQLAKYVPGSVWHFATKAGMLAPRYADASKTGRLMATEVAWVIGSATIVGSGMLAASFVRGELPIDALRLDAAWLLPVIGVLGLTVVAMNRRWAFLHLPTPGVALRLGAIWMLLGASFAAVVTAVPTSVSMNLSLGILLTGAFAVGYVAGFVAPFAPAGLGVREGVLIALLGPAIGVGEAIVTAALSRLVYVVAELVVAIPTFAPRGDRPAQR
jgi:hypothetical protein